jgi:dTDP-4-dehydrorhamnose 3,5-epimerase
MQATETVFKGVWILRPGLFTDTRGYFFESYNQKALNEAKIDFKPVQDNESYSVFGTIRGLHFQKEPYAQAKLIRVILGEIKEVIIDLRENSGTYGESFTIVIGSEDKTQLFIPKGFAHGFSVLSEEAIVLYKCDNFYHPESEAGINYLDPDLHIDWQIPQEKRIVSEKDKNLPFLKDLNYKFPDE